MDYNSSAIEQKWQQYWEENDIYKVSHQSDKPKYYVLDMFPYPSGAGLHVGHPLGYIASDIYARYKSLTGYNVLHPMGFDAFGLPAEQYAIETGQHPETTTRKNIATYKSQLRKLGFNYDWSREVATCDADYYKWTQWIFLQMYHHWYDAKTDKSTPISDLTTHFAANGTAGIEANTSEDSPSFTAAEWNAMNKAAQERILMNYRLMYQSYSMVNWCSALGTVLANDEVVNGVSERGGHPVERKQMRQWFLRTTAFAERLLDDLNGIDWSDAMKEMQRNWIGRSEGAQLFFNVKGSDKKVEVFTTRPDTIFGVTFMVVAPEHELVAALTTPEQTADVEAYLKYVGAKTDVERQAEKTVTGAFTGAYCVNPATGDEVPIWISEYVLIGYGTGAIMAVPSDDERDEAFATKFGIDIIEVIDKSGHIGSTKKDKSGVMINSGFVTGMQVPDAIKAVIDEIEKKGIGTRKINYRLRDAGYSRQRYWGEPFPIVYQEDVPVALDESELPLTLPQVESYKPTGTGASPLASVEAWVNTPEGQRETDTMPGYAGSSWYFLRYMDPNNSETFAGQEAIDYWKNVDFYIGGTEHAVGHLLYSRTWHKFLFDKGLVPTNEPFQRLVNQGMIQGISSKIFRGVPKDKAATDANLSMSNKLFYIDKAGEHASVELEKASTIFYCAGVAKQLEEEAIEGSWLHVTINTVHEHGTDQAYLDKDSMEKLGKWKPNFQKAVFVCAGGYYQNGDFHAFENAKYEGANKLYTKSLTEKMSKSKYNVVNPDDMVAEYGADVFRMFEMFLGPIEMSKPWNTKGIVGVSKFMRRFWALFRFDEAGNANVSDETPTNAELKVLHKTIKKVRIDIERLSFNTCISAFMEATNAFTSQKSHKRALLETMVVMLSPFAPYVSEELWHKLGNTGSVHHGTFPEYEEKYTVEASYTYPVQINGKVRAKIDLPMDISKADAEKIILAHEAIASRIAGKTVRKFIFVPKRIVNVVAK